jgi:hypothetical protein
VRCALVSGPRAILNVAEKRKSQSWHVFESRYFLVAQPHNPSVFSHGWTRVYEGTVSEVVMSIEKWYPVYRNLSLIKRKFKRKIIDYSNMDNEMLI